MFPSSFLGSSLAHLEPELGPFEVDDIGDDDDLSHDISQTAKSSSSGSR